MENKRRWINYDWFKLIVVLILLVIFVILILQKPQASTAATAVNSPPTETNLPVGAAVGSATPVPASLSTLPPTATLPPTTTLPPPAATSQPAPTQTPLPTAQPTTAPTLEPTAQPTAAQPVANAPAASGDCSKALPTRLKVGDKARVLVNLFMRSLSGMDHPVLLINLPGTQLDVIGGPVCLPYGEGVYRWWNVKNPAGQMGWVAEGSLLGKNYFLEPLP